ncbi:MAG: hypothetical protein JXA30_05055 [Deltaproteobacteria bacterium]|nr:hypothetical protein [Deltaproteobacteria bacterium]
MISATNNWLLVFDNISTIPQWLSDALCRITTGGGFATRALYSDSEEKVFDAMRPMILNGIDEIIRKADLGDRALVLVLSPIPKENRRGNELLAEFEKAKARILGRLFDVLSQALLELPRATTELRYQCRMIEFARLGFAAEKPMGWEPGSFEASYRKTQESLRGELLESDCIAVAVKQFMKDRSEWSGTATDMLAQLTEGQPENIANSRGWPKNARGLSSSLKRIAPLLRDEGIQLDWNRGRRRTITIVKSTESSVDCDEDTVKEQ